MSDLRGISEKCADVLKMHEPLVVLDDVVVTIDEEKILYIVSKEDGTCKKFKLGGDSGLEEITGEEQSNAGYSFLRYLPSRFSYKDNICGYGSKIYLFCPDSFSKEQIYVFDVKTFETTYMDAMLGGDDWFSDCTASPQCNEQYIVYNNGKSQLVYQDLNTEKTKCVRYEDGNVVMWCDSFKLLGTQIYFKYNSTNMCMIYYRRM